LIAGGGGVFDVHVNGSQVWSKFKTGRFPEHREIIEKVQSLVGKS
jgi:selT/selW/selH-like putative selenoprotein